MMNKKQLEDKAAPVTRDVASAGPVRNFVRRFRSQNLAIMSLVFIIVLALVSLLAPWIMPHDPNAQSLLDRNLGSSGTHPLGTDDLGRDLFSRMIDGTSVTLSAPLIAVAVGLALGLPTGLIAGYVGGVFDWFATKIADSLFAIPGVLLAMAIVAVRGPSTTNAMIAVGILFAPRIFRLVRAEAIQLRKQTFIEASVTVGAGPGRILFNHVMPNIGPTIIVQCTILLAMGVLVEAALSFFGIGVQPPDASWGVLLRRSFDNMNEAPLQSIPPGLAITLLVLAFQLLGDGIRDSIGKETRRG